MNVNERERLLSILAGGALVLGGLMRRSLGGAAIVAAGGALVRRGITGHSLLYQKLGLHTAGGREIPRKQQPTDDLQVRRAITVRRPAAELHAMWRDPEVQRRIMADIAEVRMTDANHARWILYTPATGRVECDIEFLEEREGESLRWRTGPGSHFTCEGSVQFRPGPSDRGTEIHLAVRFPAPAGALPEAATKLLGMVPRQAAFKMLWRFKTLAETGDIPSIKNQPAGRNGGRDR